MTKLRSWAGLTLAITMIAGCGSPETEGSGTSDLNLKGKAARIAIVGAGPSGLEAAYQLKQNGYTNVTVFEKTDHVGGKVMSYDTGSGITELGAVFASPDYRVVLGLANTFNIPYVPSTLPQYVITPSGAKMTFQDYLQSKYTTVQILEATVAYAAVQTLFLKAIQQDGFTTLLPTDWTDLYLPFGQFANKYGIAPIADAVKCLMIGFGYGYYEDTPAFYYLKLIGWLLKIGGPNGLEPATYYSFPTGYQSLWKAVAATLNVKLNSTVTKVTRTKPSLLNPFPANPVQVSINGGAPQNFDQIIISAPLDKVPAIVTDLPASEQSLFASVGGERYVVNLFTAGGLPLGESDFIYNNTFENTVNHASVWANSNPAVPVYIDYQIVDPNATEDAITAALASDIASYGPGQLGSVLLRQEWPEYFPHVTSTAMQRGFYNQVQAIQGEYNTFYVGGTLSFETVEHSARYAQTLVNTYFPK